ncbi:hypothetical protein ACHQM5_030390 [Ranunculus cassubicifolius]
MGGCFSCKSPCSFDAIRVVHLSGYLEDFNPLTTAKEVLNDRPKHFLCTMSHLVHGSRPIRPEVQLETGQVYFLLPYSVLASDTSPVELVALASRLLAIAKKTESCKVEKRECVFGARSNKDMYLRASPAPTWKPILESIVERSMEHTVSMDRR